MSNIGTKIIEQGSTAGGVARVDYKAEDGTTVFGFDDTAKEATGAAVTTTGEASKLLKFSSVANTLLHFLRIRKSSTTALNVQDDSSVDVFNVDTTNKTVTSYNQKIASLAGPGNRMVTADATGTLTVDTRDLTLITESLTPVNTGININGGMMGKTIMAYVSIQWDTASSTASAIYMIRCGYNGDFFNATLISSDNYYSTSQVVFTQVNGYLYVNLTNNAGTKIRFIIN